VFGAALVFEAALDCQAALAGGTATGASPARTPVTSATAARVRAGPRAAGSPIRLTARRRSRGLVEQVRVDGEGERYRLRAGAGLLGRPQQPVEPAAVAQGGGELVVE